MFNLLMKSNKKRAKRRGFTLVELIIVIVILGVLAGVAALSFSDVTKSSKDGVAKANLRALKSACQVYQADNNGLLPKDWAAVKKYCENKLQEAIDDTTDDYTYEVKADTNWKFVEVWVKGNGLKGKGSGGNIDPKDGSYYKIEGSVKH